MAGVLVDWRGVTNDVERRVLRRYEAILPDYALTPEVWALAIRLADRGRAAGETVPLADLLVFSCARIHGLELAHADAHFDDLAGISV